MGVALSLWPAKGLALPFFSYGGTNLVVSMCAVAILLQVARQGSRDLEEDNEESRGLMKPNMKPNRLIIANQGGEL
jgi:hypothetical protein